MPELQNARLAAACPVAADAFAEAALRRDVPRAVGPERESSDVLDAKVVEAQDAERRGQLARQGQRDVPQQALRGRSWRPEPEQQVL